MPLASQCVPSGGDTAEERSPSESGPGYLLHLILSRGITGDQPHLSGLDSEGPSLWLVGACCSSLWAFGLLTRYGTCRDAETSSEVGSPGTSTRVAASVQGCILANELC